MSGTVAVDFDGTLHPYTRGWQGPVPDDEPPVEGAERFLVTLNERGYNIVIFTTRADTPAGEQGVVKWLARHMPYATDLLHTQGQHWRITSRKVPAFAYVDDRGVEFTRDSLGAGNWGVCLSRIEALAPRGHGAPVVPKDPSPG